MSDPIEVVDDDGITRRIDVSKISSVNVLISVGFDRNTSSETLRFSDLDNAVAAFGAIDDALDRLVRRR